MARETPLTGFAQVPKLTGVQKRHVACKGYPAEQNVSDRTARGGMCQPLCTMEKKFARANGYKAGLIAHKEAISQGQRSFCPTHRSQLPHPSNWSIKVGISAIIIECAKDSEDWHLFVRIWSPSHYTKITHGLSYSLLPSIDNTNGYHFSFTIVKLNSRWIYMLASNTPNIYI